MNVQSEQREPRSFTKKQRIAVELVTGRTGEADHIVPYSKGGRTTVENCQMIDPTVNRKKGAFCFKPREWQEKFLQQWEKRTESYPFMLIAIPGSGKTMAALEAARRWISAGADRRLIIVVPSDNLRRQWQHEARRFGLELQTKEFGTNFKSGFQGGVATYQLVAGQSELMRKLCTTAPTMVIFDEIHHCGDDTSFGIGIRYGFECAREILCMSGTPWKTDGTAIPFVRYDGDGFAVADFRYDYPHALTDEVVRPLVFDHAKGVMQNDITGERLELDGGISEDKASARLRIILDPLGEYVRKQIADAHRKLLECRKSVPDAAAMAICIDQVHASKIAEVIRRETGCRPSIIVSDEQIENDSIEAFRDSTKEWLVSVRKVSEGTDIKRLQVLCYLTNVTSELFFRQVIGRVSRVREKMEDHEGYVYIPADPRLIRCASNIDNAQTVAQREKDRIDLAEIEKRERQQPLGSWTTEHSGTETVLIGNARVPVSEAREIERLSEAVGISMQKAMEVFAFMRGSSPRAQREDTQPQTQSLEDQCDELRRKCNKRAVQLARKLGVEPREIHMRFKRQAEMSLAELQSKLKALIAEGLQC